jgi:hypothetical protein
MLRENNSHKVLALVATGVFILTLITSAKLIKKNKENESKMVANETSGLIRKYLNYSGSVKVFKETIETIPTTILTPTPTPTPTIVPTHTLASVANPTIISATNLIWDKISFFWDEREKPVLIVTPTNSSSPYFSSSS